METKENVIRERSYQFALRIIKLSSGLPKTNVGNILGKQILRSGTSVGANIEEAVSAVSKEDFTYKMNIALKEARETKYWLRLISDSALLPLKRLTEINQESEEKKKILASIVKTLRSKN